MCDLISLKGNLIFCNFKVLQSYVWIESKFLKKNYWMAFQSITEYTILSQSTVTCLKRIISEIQNVFPSKVQSQITGGNMSLMKASAARLPCQYLSAQSPNT